jgi:hypothetical protein
MMLVAGSAATNRRRAGQGGLLMPMSMIGGGMIPLFVMPPGWYR